MAERLIVNEDRPANEVFTSGIQLNTKKPFVEPHLTKHESLIENTLAGATGVSGAVALS